MTFGLVKSIIEENLLESYKDEKSFKKAMNEFKQNILNHKEISKIYSLYDDLSKPQSLSEQDAKEFVSEGISLIQKLLPKVKLPKIVGESKVENKYKTIDELVYIENKVSILERMELKKKLYKLMTESQKSSKETIQIPLSTMVKIANQTVQKYVENLDENSKKELFEILKEDSNELQNKFDILKESAISKLTPMVESESDSETKSKLQETISKIQGDTFTQLNFLKLKKLTESL
jgi:hypothetical protein